MDGRNPAPPGIMIPYKYQQTMVSHGSKVVQDFVHPQYEWDKATFWRGSPRIFFCVVPVARQVCVGIGQN